MHIEIHEVVLEDRRDGTPVTTGVRTGRLELPEGSSVAEALALLGRRPSPATGLSVFGRRISEMEVLHDGDRLELSPALIVDPREARRRRAERQGDVRVVTCGRHGGRRGADRG